jgi:hypothetical protein
MWNLLNNFESLGIIMKLIVGNALGRLPKVVFPMYLSIYILWLGKKNTTKNI